MLTIPEKVREHATTKNCYRTTIGDPKRLGLT